MPCLAYALTYPTDTAEAIEALAVVARKAYDDLAIAKTGALWGGLQIDRVVNTKKPIKRFRSRSTGMRVFMETRPGDVVIFPEYIRAFRHRNDFMAHGRRWVHGNVRVLVLDIDFDSATDACKKALEIMNHVYAKAKSRSAVDGTPRQLPNEFIGRPIMGLEVRGSKRFRRVVVVRDLYELGVKVREWEIAGWRWADIATHLFEHKIFRPMETRGSLGVLGSIRSTLVWSAESLKKLAQNIPKIDDGVLEGKFMLPTGWRPASGPLSEIPEKVTLPGGATMPVSRWMKAKQLGGRIKAIRKEKGILQSQLARSIGLNQSQISDVEMGKHLPFNNTLELLAKGLGVPVTEFLVREPEEETVA